MTYTKAITLLDGAMGTMLQRAGLKLGDRPETLSITAADVVEKIQRQYVQAGTRMLLANTFCANAHKLAGTGFDVEEVDSRVCRRGEACLCRARTRRYCWMSGLSASCLNRWARSNLTKPMRCYAQMIRAGAEAGAEGVFFETFSDLNELRAGVLAAKECSDLPVFASMTFEASGRTFLGCRADAAAMALDALGVDALGVNCSLGPKEIAPILKAMRDCTNLAADSQTECRSARSGNGRLSHHAWKSLRRTARR